MWIMKPTDRAELEEYREIGTPAEIRARLARLARPYPDDEGLAPRPWSDREEEQ